MPSEGQKVRARHTDALGKTSWYDGKVVRQEGEFWRVDLGGIAVLFKPEDIHAQDEQDPQSHAGVPGGQAP
jgi:hypothetical protein